MQDHPKEGVLANLLMRMFDAEFGHPRATVGRIGGGIMLLANAE
jgi:hypothetical protein